MRWLIGGGLISSSPLTRRIIYRHSCTKLFVGGLSYDTNEPVLKEAFKSHGEILEVKVICHHVTGKSKGYGFVQFTCENAANTALREMDGQVITGYWKVESFALNVHTRAKCKCSLVLFDFGSQSVGMTHIPVQALITECMDEFVYGLLVL